MARFARQTPILRALRGESMCDSPASAGLFFAGASFSKSRTAAIRVIDDCTTRFSGMRANQHCAAVQQYHAAVRMT
jgi:hypothetical protein